MQRRSRQLTFEQARQKALRYCAYQERSHQEVRNKLHELGLSSSDSDELLAYLITEGFLNEERFAKLFAGGKFRVRQWGRIKIAHALEGKGLSQNCIRLGIKEIDEEDYLQTLQQLISRKIDEARDSNPFVIRDKISKSIIQKGYEPELVWKMLKTLLPE